MSHTIVANIVLAESSVSSLALHQEAVEYFAAGHTILQAASQYATGADTFFHRGLVWIIQSGFNLLPANDKGKAPSIKQHMEAVSADSKNAARAMLQEVYSLAWQASQKGIDPLAFASLRAMRDGVRAKNKEVPNASTSESLANAAEAIDTEQGEAAPVKLSIASEDVARMMHAEEVLALVAAELAKAKPSIKALRDMIAA